MAKVTLRNLNDVHRKDPNLGQALDDVINQLSAHKASIDQLKALVAAIQKKVGM